ncbi:hypothetical protein [Acinetobacter defluvii]|uniref:hypothetical protein n=1 Tax=Acinetobacter defluvii TaxID=1871111 RepID=UPI003AF69651
MDILNAKQAFEAMSSGQAVLCRAVGQLLDFGELSQFPATVFFGTDYEFCLAPRFMMIGQLDLEVPECIQGFDDLIDAAMYYAPNLLDVDRPIEILSTADNATYLKRLIASKLLHKTADDAITHARAFITLNGGSLDPVESGSPVVVETPSKEVGSTPTETVEEKPKKRTRKAKEPVTTDAIEASVETVATDTIDDLYASFEYQICQATTLEALMQIRATFSANGTLSDKQHGDLNTCFSEKMAELDPEQYAPKTDIETVAQEEVTVSEDSLVEDTGNEYKKLLNELLDAASKAHTPKQANALYRYTTNWTEEQRKPLVDAIHKRLNELNVGVEADVQLPSLMVRIHNSKNEHELNELLPEIRSRHPDIQPKLMGYIRARRFELENGAAQ